MKSERWEEGFPCFQECDHEGFHFSIRDSSSFDGGGGGEDLVWLDFPTCGVRPKEVWLVSYNVNVAGKVTGKVAEGGYSGTDLSFHEIIVIN